MIKPRVPHHAPTDPIKGTAAIALVVDNIRGSPRDLALFTLGTNLAFRAGDLLSLDLGDVRGLSPGDELRLKERKTGNRRSVTVNRKVIEALEVLLLTRVGEPDDAPLFVGQKRRTRLTVETLGRLVKRWCKLAGLTGNYSSHTLRKTFGYTLRKEHKLPLEIIQRLYGHSSGAITLNYVSIQPDELRDAYMIGI